MPGSRSYFVYILASGHHGTLYIGVTNNIWRRMAQHRAGKGSKFVKKYGATRLVYAEEYDSVTQAIARESSSRTGNGIGRSN
jgi:putative endonuclease